MGFEQYHPAINLLYFVCVIWSSLCFQQPVFLAISYLCGFLYSVKRNGWRSLALNLSLLPLVVLFALFYSGYHHFGITVFRQNFIGNNLTLESLLYGLTLGISYAAAVMWFSCVFSVFTTDKIVYLFGRISPRLSLFLAVSLRMLPRLKAQAKRIGTARQAVGLGLSQGSLFHRLSHRVKMLSILITWFLESLPTVSDAMRSRGCALKGRTAFSIYRFDNRDRSLVIVMFACLTLIGMAIPLGQTGMTFDPKMILNPITSMSCLFYAGYAVLCLLPMMLEFWAEYRYHAARRLL